ncbi:MAG: PQQ-dependent sugar dehydrogenase [Candidatus Sungbacteria bacterium]|nr:PQQ-dependent sugar dehydrogenase [Candidatus Sungbacteria bacterium]
MVAIVGIAVLVGVIFYWSEMRGVWPAVNPPPSEKTEDAVSEPNPAKNTTGLPLKLPDGFSIEIFAKNLPGARVMAFDGFGNMWVSRTSEGAVTLLEVQDGAVKNQSDIFRNLRKPHGLAFEDFILYIAEEHRVSRVGTYTEDSLHKIADLPTQGGGHFTRTLGFGPDGRLYVSIGSSCNVCREQDEHRAAIWSLNKDGSDFRLFARGLRNSVFFTWHPETEQMWATEMGRDLLGDDIPPDEVNIITEEDPSTKLGVKNYGWPTCYGKNIHDAAFDKNTYIRNPCMEPFEQGSAIDIPAHSAPLGLAFIPNSWSSEYRGDLLVAYHGSWNRSTPTGYKVVRMKFDAAGAYEDAEDFISGWLVSASNALGRPVDLVFGPDDALYVSDDKAGVVYRVFPQKVQ